MDSNRIENRRLRIFCGFLCLALCCMAGFSGAAQAETDCLCKRADPVVVPGPTPKPMPMREGGMPAMSLSFWGMPAEDWMRDFFRYCQVLDIPVAREEFEFITEFGDDEIPGVLFSRYRIVAGGAEVFLQMVDGETVDEWVVCLDGDAMPTKQVQETLLYYFPLVLQACVYASEESVTASEAEEITRQLHPDIRSLALLGEEWNRTIRPHRAHYCLRNEPQHESLFAYGTWER